jgi:hypothetical protein
MTFCAALYNFRKINITTNTLQTWVKNIPQNFLNCDYILYRNNKREEYQLPLYGLEKEVCDVFFYWYYEVCIINTTHLGL